ncbi:hypothetical protein [Rhizobium sp. WYJ-E13]|uniref:hypothetical protein n=1 Tax=Rhizobium sp. WYJ-E13 TaxID=2849093 RepID=UPI001C1F0DC0|nr:hypothetical protein [Rhizobium sp. WYJ-E13]QWW70123.1 hypothetical protein KQ933_10695 [Rhizobium sp. WYJ-E13]
MSNNPRKKFYVLLALPLLALLLYDNRGLINVTFPERGISDAARLTGSEPHEIRGRCKIEGRGLIQSNVSCVLTRVKDGKLTHNILLEYSLVLNSIMDFSDSVETVD